MSLSASMWTSVSGLMTHGEKMNVIGNNIANVSTIGFKAQRADFSDYLYTDYGTTSGVDQSGKGVAVCALIGDYSQGAFESTNSATDLAINGDGFFKVHNDQNGGYYYTRAGDFYFNEDRELVNPSGLILQGWRTSENRSVSFSNGTANINTSSADFSHEGAPTDIVLDKWNITPQRTTNVTVSNNLVNNDTYDKTTSSTSPMTSLFDTWDGRKEVPLADSAYATQSTVKVYDDSGNPHDITVYMDRVNTENMTNLPAGYNMYEYLVTMDPAEDKRMYDGTVADGVVTNGKSFSDTRAAGVLMTGVMVFDASGTLINQTAYTYGAQQSPSSTSTNNGSQCSQDPITTDADGNEIINKESWQPTKLSNNGLPVFTANFSGKGLANSVSEADAENNLIELDLGLNYTEQEFDNNNSLDNIALDYSALALMKTKDSNGDDANYITRDNKATACNGTTFMNDIQADGYTAGLLSNYSIDTEGVLYGHYTNGENIPLYQISMYDFHSTQGLYREGGNLFSSTRESGAPVEGVAGTGTFGKINSYYIENSNVDMSREFVHIATQRGFQANSKSITTTDTMLETVIGMKR